MRLNIKISVVLLLLDDFDGSAVMAGGGRFWLDGKRASPILKPGGYYVFTGTSPPRTIHVECPRYMPVEVLLEAPEQDNALTPLSLRLVRQGGFPAGGCEWVRGIHKPGAWVYALTPETPPLAIQRLDSDGLILRGYTARSLSGLRYAVGSGKKRELVILTERRPDGSYSLETPPKRRHEAGEALLRAYGAVCGEDGGFLIPVGRGVRDLIKTVEFYDKGAGAWGSLSVTGPS